MKLFKKIRENRKTVLLMSLTLLALLSFGVLYTLLQRDEVEAGWWDETWMYRKEIDISYSGTENLTEYQVLIDNLDTASLITSERMQSDCDDIRFISSSGQVLDYSMVGNSCNTTETEIWVKVDSIPASNVTIYFYYGNPSATSYQSEENTFTYSTEKPVGYVLQSGVTQLNVISLSDNNSITHNGATLSLAKYGTDSFTSINQWGPISAKGLFNADSPSDNTDMLVPVSWAGTEFLFYARYTSLTLYALAPWEDATVDIYSNGTSACTGNSVTSTGSTVSCTLPATGQVKVVSNYPILLFYISGSSDPMALRPSSAKKWVGGSQSTYFLSNSLGADFRYITSTTASETNPADLAADSYSSSGGGSYGGSPAFLTRSTDNPIGVHQQADSDGNDSHMYILLNEMGTTWGSAVSNTDYISVASDQPATCSVYDTTSTLLGSGTATSSNSSIYFLGFGTGNSTSWTTQDWYMECDAPVAAHYQKGADSESGLLTYPMMRQFTYPTPTVGTSSSEVYRGDIVKIALGDNSSGDSVNSNLIGYWKFDEGSGSTAYDSSVQENNGTITGSSWVNEGRVKKALSFNGSSDYVSVSSVTGLNTGNSTHSISAWIKPGPKPSVRQWPILLGGATTGNHHWLYNTSGTMTLGAWSGSQCTITPDVNEWNHIVVTFDGINMNCYKNGKLEDNYPSASFNFTSNSLTIAQDPRGTEAYFNGIMDEVKIYNIALTPEQVLLDYNRGMTVTLSNSPSTIGNIWGGSASSEYCIPGDTSPCNPPVGEWLFDENQGSIAKDTSGNGNDGTLTNMDNTNWTKGADNSGSGLNFSETTDIVSLPNVPDPPSVFTVSLWARAIKVDDWGYIFHRGPSNTIGASIIWIGINTDGNYAASVNGRYTQGATTITANKSQWRHISLTYDGNTQKIYIDGKLLVSDTFGSITNSITGNLTGIGGTPHSTSYRPIDGDVDQVRIYDYARTPAQIAWDYNRGAPIGHWRLDECQGTTVNDITGNGNNGTINIGSTLPQTSAGTCTSGNTADAWYNGREGKFESSLSFDGNDDYAEIPNDSSLDLTGAFTISGWFYVKGNGSGSYPGSAISKWWDGITRGFNLQVQTTSIKFVWREPGAGADSTLETTGLTLNNDWHHIVIKHDGITGYIYLDTIEKDSLVSNSLDTNNAVLRMGRYVHTSLDSYYNGLIDDVRIYNYPLTEEQIKLLYNNNSAVRF